MQKHPERAPTVGPKPRTRLRRVERSAPVGRAPAWLCMWWTLAGVATPVYAQDGNAPLSSEATTPEERYRRAASLMDAGDCAAVLALLEGLHLPGLLADERRVLDVHRMRGHCLVLLSRTDEASRQFEDVLYIDPNHELDAFRTPPDVIACFERTRRELQEKQLEFESVRRAPTAPPAPRAPVQWIERERRVQAVPLAAVLLPAGIGQWLNGDASRALWFGGAQLAALGLNIGCYWGMQATRSAPSPGPDEVSRYALLQGGQIAALGALGLAYGWGVADAWTGHQALREISMQTMHEEISEDEARRRLDPSQ